MTTTSAPETKGSADLGFALDDLLRAFETYKEENDRRIADVETRGAADPLTPKRSTASIVRSTTINAASTR